MPPSFTVHCGQHDAKCVTFEVLLHAAFVADEIWDDMLKPARSAFKCGAHLKEIIPRYAYYAVV